MLARSVAILIMAALVSLDASAQQSFKQLESTGEFELAIAAVDAPPMVLKKMMNFITRFP
jgi:hypothetical protein